MFNNTLLTFQVLSVSTAKYQDILTYQVVKPGSTFKIGLSAVHPGLHGLIGEIEGIWASLEILAKVFALPGNIFLRKLFIALNVGFLKYFIALFSGSLTY